MQDLISSLNESEQKQIYRKAIITSCIALTWTVANVITEIFTIDEIREKFFNANESEGINTSNLISGASSLISNIPMAFALIYYTQRQALNKITQANLELSSMNNEHSHGSHHHHSCHDRIQHIIAHWIALWLPSFCLAAAAGFAAFSGQELTDIDQKHYVKTMPWALTVAIFATLGDATLHLTFLEQGEHEHGNFLSSFRDIMIQKPYDLYQNNQCQAAFFAAWMTWGTFFAHISELTFSINKGLNILAQKPCEYLFNYSIPKSILTFNVMTLAILGAAMHSHSENKAWFQLFQKKTICQLNCKDLKQEYNWFLKTLFLITAAFNSLWHTAPEIPGLPEELIFPYNNTLTSQLISFIGIIVILGIPDFITNFSLTAQAVAMWDKPQTNSPLLSNTPPIRSFVSHLDSPQTLPSGLSFP